ncbi:MAG: hypothetical protein KDJ45_11010 [Hyphomicrobiaceae bacterium]|nr:hypothetical protein [Hyphomicrobiaceae bacterium]MCC0010773.1 hypothetical protein [Hyphomicrobiaceae bacterium]
MEERDPRLVQRLFANFEKRHTTLTNRLMQFIAQPVLLWSGFALAKALPEPATLAAIPGVDWAVVAAVVISGAYAVLSVRIGLAMAIVSLVMIVIAAFYQGDAALPLWQPAIFFLGLGIFLWLVGRRIEGRPRVLSEMFFDLMIAPAWVLARILELLRIGY